MMAAPFDPDWQAKGYAHAIRSQDAVDIKEALEALMACLGVVRRAAQHDLHARRVYGQIQALLYRRVGFMGDVQ